jgi:hypothetical protein
MSFSQGSDIFLSTSFSRTSKFRSSLQLRNKVSHAFLLNHTPLYHVLPKMDVSLLSVMTDSFTSQWFRLSVCYYGVSSSSVSRRSFPSPCFPPYSCFDVSRPSVFCLSVFCLRVSRRIVFSLGVSRPSFLCRCFPSPCFPSQNTSRTMKLIISVILKQSV